jgi:cytochrome c-type biogenesis protein
MNTISQGSLLIASLVALLAGVVSFLSPCVLPLVPGYLSFITGFGINNKNKIIKSKALLATSLFILGFTFVFVCIGMFFGTLGGWFLENGKNIERIMGFFIVLMGLSYLGIGKLFNREYKFHPPIKPGLIGAPFLGAVFAIGWTPCIGPTLAAVQALAFNQASIGRGAILSTFYGLGLGLPFLVITLIIEKSINSIRWLRTKQKTFINFGGVLLILVGLLLATGLWNDFTIWLRVSISGFTPII